MEVSPSKSRKALLYAFAALLLVGLAATAAVVGSNQVASSANLVEPYLASRGDVTNCDYTAPDFEASLPKWDPEYTKEAAFYNACYYSFRCCTTTGNGNGCYVSEEYGDRCRSCLGRHPPKVVKPICTKYMNDDQLAEEEVFTTPDLLKDESVPTPTSEYGTEQYYMMTTLDSCWVKPGTEDVLVTAYTDKCFEVLSWCNLLCPRDDVNTVEHVLCKHCTLFGYNAGASDAYKSDITIGV